MPPHCIELAANKKASPLSGGPYFSIEYFTSVCWQNDSIKVKFRKSEVPGRKLFIAREPA